MLKKILAGSTAGVLALTALASTAMAEETPDIVIEQFEKIITVEFVAELSAAQIEQLIANTATTPSPTINSATTYLAAKDDDKMNSYSNIALSLWCDPSVKIGQGIWFNGGTVDVKLQGQLKDQYMIQNGTQIDIADDNSPVSTGTIPSGANVSGSFATAPGYAADLSGVIAGHTADTADTATISVPNATGVVTDLGTKGGPAGYVIDNATKKILGTTDKNPAKGQYDKDYTAEKTIANNVGWLASNTSEAGKVTSPVIINGAFGLSATTTLEGIDFDDSTVKVTFSMGGSESDWGTVLNATTVADSWHWNNASWTSLMDIINSQGGQDIISSKFGIVGESGVVVGGAYVRKAGMSNKVDVKVAKKSEEWKNVALPMVASVPVGVGQNASIPTLQKMNNGGKMRFEFDKDLSSAIVVGQVIFYGTSGQVALPVGSDFAWEDGGKTLVMDFPANLTYDPSMNNKYNSFKASYAIQTQNISGVVTGDALGNTNFTGSDQYGQNHLMKITFTANAEAPKDDDNSSGGLVEKPNDSNSNSEAPSNSNGGNSGNEKNPSTGVAVAVAPVVLATAAAAVVISKKRK